MNLREQTCVCWTSLGPQDNEHTYILGGSKVERQLAVVLLGML